MFKLIDRTLTGLKIQENNFESEKLLRMCELLVKLGTDYIEVSVPLLEKVGTLPVGGNYILQVDSQQQMEKYPGFEMYTKAYEGEEELQDNVIYEIKTKEVQPLMKNTKLKTGSNIRVTGLDNLICKNTGEQEGQFLQDIKKVINFCPGDENYCATALAIEWLMTGGRSLSLSFNGIGGYAKLEEVLMGTKVIMHKKIKQDLSVLQEISKVYEELTGKRIYYNKAVVGKNIFNLEAGIQIEKNVKKPVVYEPYAPETIGKVRRIVIGKNSGYSALKLKLMEKGIKVPESIYKPLLEVVRDKSMGRGRSLTDKEFLVLVQEVMADEA